MFKKSLIFSLIAILAVIFLYSSSSFGQTMPKMTVSLSKKSYKPGDKGVITIKIKPGEGVHIPKDPLIEVTLTGDGVEGTGLQDYSGAPGGDYFDNPVVKYNFTVSGSAESGTTIAAKVKVKFGYCSTESGVCKIGTKTSNIKIKVK
jgi:hypothetical protein